MGHAQVWSLRTPSLRSLHWLLDGSLLSLKIRQTAAIQNCLMCISCLKMTKKLQYKQIIQLCFVYETTLSQVLDLSSWIVICQWIWLHMNPKDQAWEPRDIFPDWLQNGFKGSDIQHKSFFDQSRKRSLQWESSQPTQRQQWLGLRCWCHPMNIHGLQIKRESVNRWINKHILKDKRVKQQDGRVELYNCVNIQHVMSPLSTCHMTPFSYEWTPSIGQMTTD